ncbi:hypothetical protein A3A45_00440 [Candidatus Daviesbacteria bacterium RIFCSPLOWO2_01_FULL_36_8]|nr:MAG: hypothetical protein A3A45_00440 [Candidatus Daviesbacteria bacterium RIFCSPLOWO2_01_FULL_36_8]
MENKWLYGIIGLLGGVLIAVLTASNAVNSNNQGMLQMMGIRNQNSRSVAMGDIYRHFIEQMIPHHEDAITMAKLAQTKEKRSEIKQLANNIIDSQGKEIKQMKDWYKNWFGKEVQIGSQVMNQHGMIGSGMHMGMMGNDTDMARLENAADFDKVFIEEMIPHHQMAVMMANMLLSGTNRAEMKQLAENIITSQTKEINDMRSWYRIWGY